MSIVTPTCGRERSLQETLRWVESQTYPNIEWLVLDDSPAPSQRLEQHSDPRIRYRHVRQRLTIGEKRNRLTAMARGEFIAHFDDDDYYAPAYIAEMVSKLAQAGADFANLSSWYLYDLRHDFFGFWALRETIGLHYGCYADRLTMTRFTPDNNAALATNYMGYGFTYVYRRRVAEEAAFGAVNWCEEAPFIDAARQRFKLLHIEDRSGLVLHLLHAGSSSSCFPQFHLPNFLVPRMFPAAGSLLEVHRAAPAPVAAQGNPGAVQPAAGFSAVVTSMHGIPSRVAASGSEIGETWLKVCVQSWLIQARHAISVAETPPADSRVQWVRSKARPAVTELLGAIPDANQPAILCNADILLGDALTRLRPALDPATFYIAHRIEVEAATENLQSLQVKQVYERGFDLFVLPPAFVRFAQGCRSLDGFRIGEPWWDYLLPLVAVAAGFPVKRLPQNEGVALHYRHSPRYDESTWLDRGLEFMSAVAALTQAAGSSRHSALLHELDALGGAPAERLKAAGQLVCSRLGREPV